MAGEGVPGSENNELKLEGNEWILPTSLEVLEPAEDAFTERLIQAGWSSDEAYFLALALHEALINAIIHRDYFETGFGES